VNATVLSSDVAAVLISNSNKALVIAIGDD
jgi:hypothetical protein